MNESDYFLYKHYAQEFHKELKKVIELLESIPMPWGSKDFTSKDSDLKSLIASYEKFEKRRIAEMQQQVVDVWTHELELHPKCKWSDCEKNRIMYSFFCTEHTTELLVNPGAAVMDAVTDILKKTKTGIIYE